MLEVVITEGLLLLLRAAVRFRRGVFQPPAGEVRYQREGGRYRGEVQQRVVDGPAVAFPLFDADNYQPCRRIRVAAWRQTVAV
jgi:hypothetical protein